MSLGNHLLVAVGANVALSRCECLAVFLHLPIPVRSSDDVHLLTSHCVLLPKLLPCTWWRASCSLKIACLSSWFCGCHAGQRCVPPLLCSLSFGVLSHYSDGLVEWYPTVAYAVGKPRMCLCLLVPLPPKDLAILYCIPTTSLATYTTQGENDGLAREMELFN